MVNAGKHAEDIELRLRVNATTADSKVGETEPQMAFTSLNHYLDLEWLQAAFFRTRKNGVPGVDGQTWDQYAEDLEANLQSLLDRAKSGTYRAPPVRRVHIPKGGSTTETRPIGIPTLEDKVLPKRFAKFGLTVHPTKASWTAPGSGVFSFVSRASDKRY